MSVIDKTSGARKTEPRDKASPLRVQLLPERGTIEAVAQEGTFSVRGANGVLNCEILSTVGDDEYAVGDPVLFTPLANEAGGVILGRIGQYAPARPRRHVSLEADNTLSLRCGDASIDLRADGKVMIRGEDVLVRAKKTKRIRAGTVSIN